MSKIAVCGIDCTVCPTYKATMTNDNALREKTAAEWSKLYKAEIKPVDINCRGCNAPEGPCRCLGSTSRPHSVPCSAHAGTASRTVRRQSCS